MTKMEELRWVRVFTPIHIPKALVEQIKTRDYTVEDFFKHHETACLRAGKEGPTLNPLSHLYVLANSENLTKGFLWLTIDPLTKNIVVQSYSVDKEYWKEGGAVKKLVEFVKEIRRKANLKKVYWITDYEKHSMRHGFKRSRSILMEYSGGEDGKDIDGGDNARGECRAVDPGAEAISV